MKKIRLYALLLVVLIFNQALMVRADELTGGEGWKAEFTSSREMVSNFSSGSFADVLDYMQPGDVAYFKVAIQNSYQVATDWYMTNEVLQSLEDAVEVAKGAGYTYLLVYHYPENRSLDKRVRVLYDNFDVGGENSIGRTNISGEKIEGLYEATDSLKDYFYLDTLYSGESGYITLEVTLDGETQGNDYQDTLAKLSMNFAVELPPEPKTSKQETNTVTEKIEYEYVEKEAQVVVIQEPDIVIQDEDTIKIVHTGDDTNLIPLYVAAFILAILLIILAIIGHKIRSTKLVWFILFAGLIFQSSIVTDASNYSGYTYTLRVFAGDQGTFNGDTNVITLTDITPGSQVDLTLFLDNINITKKPVYSVNEATGEKEINRYESKYSVRGIRESGLDNDEVNGSVFTVNHDMDVVVAYRVNGGDTPYIVRYIDAETGAELCKEETFYGYVGERIVVSYKYFEGYVPQDTYNYSFIIKDASEDENINYVTFKYKRSSTGGNGDDSGDTVTRIIKIDADGKITYEYVKGNVIHIPGNEQTIFIHDGGGHEENTAGENAAVEEMVDLDPEEIALNDGSTVISILPTLLNILDKSPIGYLLSPNSVMRGYIFMGCLICIGIVALIILWILFHSRETRERIYNVFMYRRRKIISNDSDLYKDILIEQMIDESSKRNEENL